MAIKKKKIGEKKPVMTPARRIKYRQYKQKMNAKGKAGASQSAWLRTQYGQITQLKGKKKK
jgi:hypothetical protein